MVAYCCDREGAASSARICDVIGVGRDDASRCARYRGSGPGRYLRSGIGEESSLRAGAGNRSDDPDDGGPGVYSKSRVADAS